MKIKIRFTLIFAFVVGIILFFFSYAIFYFSEDYRKNDFQTRLQDRAIEKLEWVVRKKQNPKLKEKINLHALIDEKISIYNNNQNLIYGGSSLPINDKITQIIKKEPPYLWNKNKREGVGFAYNYKNNKYLLLISAYDKHGINYIENLKRILIVRLIIITFIIVISGWLFVSFLLKPISDIVRQAEKITHSNLSLRLSAKNANDEIGHLTATFNRMLDRLETAFTIQKRFVSNASHELRNPLTAISGKIDVALMKEREKEEYKETLKAVSIHIKNLNTLTNNLLELANSDVETLFQNFDEIRIDEILWNAREEIIKQKSDYHIYITFENISDNANELICKGKSKLLETAFINIIDNACKYSSDKTVKIKVITEKKNTIIFFSDKGIGMPENYLTHIFEPFYRGNNVHGIPGKGIGLALVRGIIKLHSGKVFVQSKQNQGTTIEVVLPNLS